MREINLPAVNTVSISFDTASMADQGSPETGYSIGIPMGNIEPSDIEALNIARSNGSKILWSTVCIEKILENIIVDYFMGQFVGACTRRQLFEAEVVQSSSFQFSFKKKLVDDIAKNVRSFKGKDRNKLQSQLKKIMEWRNAFAHGTLRADSKDGVILEYYSGSRKAEILNETFWNTVESIFISCDQLVRKLDKDLSSEQEA